VVTGHKSGKSVFLNDELRSAYAFKTVNGFEHTYMWAAKGNTENDPDAVDRELPKSALPAKRGSIVYIVTFPPAVGRYRSACRRFRCR
jgi:hypothetical protein